MKKAGWLVGLVMLALVGGCAFVLGGSDGRSSAYLGNPRETVHLLHEKLGYLQQIEHALRDGLAAAKASPSTTDDQQRAMEVRLLEARARRVDVQLQLARWRRPAKSDKAKSGKAKSDKAQSGKAKSDKGSK